MVFLNCYCSRSAYFMVLFTMKGVAPKDVTMGDIIASAIPYFIMNLIVIGLMLIFPSLVLWLPGLMK